MQGIDGLLNWLMQGIDDFLNWLMQGIDGLLNWLMQGIDGLLNWLMQGIDGLLNWLMQGIDGLLNWLLQGIDGLFDSRELIVYLMQGFNSSLMQDFDDSPPYLTAFTPSIITLNSDPICSPSCKKNSQL